MNKKTGASPASNMSSSMFAYTVNHRRVNSNQGLKSGDREGSFPHFMCVGCVKTSLGSIQKAKIHPSLINISKQVNLSA